MCWGDERLLNSQQQALLRVLDLFDEAGCLTHVILIGSWAEFVYRECGLLKGFIPTSEREKPPRLISKLSKKERAAVVAFLEEYELVLKADSNQ